MKLTALALASCAALASAYPVRKTCVTQTGSDSNGVPLASADFTAMGATWTKGFTAPSSLFNVTGGKLTISPPSGAYGFFAISDTANVSVASGTASSCTAGCDRLVCVTGDTDVQLSMSDSDSATCATTRLVVGYANSKTSGNTLEFATVNACDSNAISVSAGSQTDLDGAASASVATAALAAAVVAAYVVSN